jgi:Saxitoxin biosynthesis operon protein SxtJ
LAYPSLDFGNEMSAETRFHEEFHREETHAGGSDRGFGLVFAVVCAIIGAINFWRGHDAWPWWLAAAAIFLFLALALPRLLRPLNWLWTKFGLLLHRVMQPIVMGLLFFSTIVPMGFALRAAGKDLLRLRLDPSARSYWIERNPPGPSPDSFKNQF